MAALGRQRDLDFVNASGPDKYLLRGHPPALTVARSKAVAVEPHARNRRTWLFRAEGKVLCIERGNWHILRPKSALRSFYPGAENGFSIGKVHNRTHSTAPQEKWRRGQGLPSSLPWPLRRGGPGRVLGPSAGGDLPEGPAQETTS